MGVSFGVHRLFTTAISMYDQLGRRRNAARGGREPAAALGVHMRSPQCAVCRRNSALSLASSSARIGARHSLPAAGSRLHVPEKDLPSIQPIAITLLSRVLHRDDITVSFQLFVPPNEIDLSSRSLKCTAGNKLNRRIQAEVHCACRHFHWGNFN